LSSKIAVVFSPFAEKYAMTISNDNNQQRGAGGGGAHIRLADAAASLELYENTGGRARLARCSLCPRRMRYQIEAAYSADLYRHLHKPAGGHASIGPTWLPAAAEWVHSF